MKTKQIFTNTKIIKEPKAGYYASKVPRGVPDFVMSRSELVRFADCPHRWRMGYDSEPTQYMEWGSLIDCLMFTADEFENQFAIQPDMYPASDGKTKPWAYKSTYCKEWKAAQEAEGRTVITREKSERAKKAIASIFGDPEVYGILNKSETQVWLSADYNDPETGLKIPVKALLDIVPDKDSEWHSFLMDLKCTSGAYLGSWKKHVFNDRLDVQGAFYLDLYNATTGEERTTFGHIIQENFEPFEHVKRLLSVEFIELGGMKYRRALALYAKCLATNTWPGFDETNAFGLTEPRRIRGWTLVEPDAWMQS